MTRIDWSVVFLYFTFSLFLGIYFTKRASRNLSEFFLSGRNAPWWLAGVSMVATTFSSDTPLYVTGLVRSQGIYENWQWWCFIFSGMLAVFFFASLWKRLGAFTDVEFISLRYSGRPAKVLRAFKALYFSLIIHTIIKAQVILAMAKILDILIGLNKWEAIGISSLITIIYCMASGYRGVLVTDFFQFIVALISAIILAGISVNVAGGLDIIKTKIAPDTMRFFPPIDESLMGANLLSFFGYIGIAWWSKYSSDGGGVIVQRVVSCRNEKEGVMATMLFNIFHYGLRTWPWILTALASIIIYPSLADPEIAYPKLVRDFMPSGLKGLMVAGFFAAFMSTLSTYLNLSSAYFINDFYKPYIKSIAPEKHYLMIARLSMIVLSALTAIVTYYVDSIVGIFKFLIAFGSGTGLVYIMRWFWWRINAWSEISAMVASTVSTIFVYTYPGLNNTNYSIKLAIIVSFSTVVWLIVTILTRPVSREVLERFYSLINTRGTNLRYQFLNFLWGVLFLTGLVLGSGKLLLGYTKSGFIYSVISVISGLCLYYNIKNSKTEVRGPQL